MKLAQHELEELKELTMSCMNTLTGMRYFIEHARDPELRKMLESHLSSHIQDYNMKVEFITKPEGAQEKLQYQDLITQYQEFSQPPTPTIANMTPRTSVVDFNDKEIASSYLLTLKRAGREYAWSAMESSTPEVRTFLEDAFRMASHHAYDVYQYMLQRGYYSITPASQQEMNSLARMFQVIPNRQMAAVY